MGSIQTVEHSLPSNDKAVIRAALPGDAANIIRLMRDVFEEGAYHLSTPEDFKVTEDEQCQMIEKFLGDPGKLMLVAEVAGQIVAILEFDNDYRQRMKHRGTVWISIASHVRDQDLGTAMGIHGWKWAVANPILEKVYMHVLHTNERSLGLCRKLGFVEEARLHKDVKLAPGEYADVIILSKQLRE